MLLSVTARIAVPKTLHFHDSRFGSSNRIGTKTRIDVGRFMAPDPASTQFRSGLAQSGEWKRHEPAGARYLRHSTSAPREQQKGDDNVLAPQITEDGHDDAAKPLQVRPFAPAAR